jgi:uncharacterized protein
LPAVPSATCRRRIAVGFLILLVLVVIDVSRPADHQVTASALVGAVRVYRAALSPLLSNLGIHCRFEPTCSRYADAVIRRHGALGGTWLALKRIVRCGPWTPMGTVDPPP